PAQLDGDAGVAVAGAAEALAALHGGALRDLERGEISNHAGPAIAMIDDHHILIAAEAAREENAAGGRRDRLGPGIGLDGQPPGVNAAVRYLADPGEQPTLDGERIGNSILGRGLG